jgi:hypothetical protein
MKKSIYLLSAILLGILTVVIYSCEKDSKETCSQDEICAAKLVTYCCTDSLCVYKYNGKEYTLDEEGQLLKDMGCTSAINQSKSTSGECTLEEVVARLNTLRAKVEEQLKLKN